MRTNPTPVVHCVINRGLPAQTHASYIRRNLDVKVQEDEDKELNIVHTPHGDFEVYYVDAHFKDYFEHDGVLVVSPNRKGWYMGEWNSVWLLRMKSIRKGQFREYEKFLDATCTFRTNNVNIWI